MQFSQKVLKDLRCFVHKCSVFYFIFLKLKCSLHFFIYVIFECFIFVDIKEVMKKFFTIIARHLVFWLQTLKYITASVAVIHLFISNILAKMKKKEKGESRMKTTVRRVMIAVKEPQGLGTRVQHLALPQMLQPSPKVCFFVLLFPAIPKNIIICHFYRSVV